MLVRIVKMSFKSDKVADFLKNFDENKHQIRNFDGCCLLELYRDKHNNTTFFTYSYWESEKHLEHYRNSQLFKTVWSKTKTMFNKKPEAWSVDKLAIVDS